MLNKSRVDKFLLVLTLPNILKASNSPIRSNTTFNLDAINFSVYGTIVPRIEVPSIEARFGGSTIQMSSHSRPTYAPIQLNFNVDNNFNNYWAIFWWLNALRDQNEGTYGIVDVSDNFTKIANLPDYSVDFSIYGLDEFKNPVVQFTYKSAFPTSLSEIRYDYQKAEEIPCMVEFAFHDMLVQLVNPNEVTIPQTT